MRDRLVQVLFGRLAALLLIGCIAGCAGSIRWGAAPRVDRLDGLKPGTSTTADVLLALGEPRGRGATRFSPDLPPRSTWFYELVESDGKNVKLKILVVFIDGQRYDGHFWFASTALVDVKE